MKDICRSIIFITLFTLSLSASASFIVEFTIFENTNYSPYFGRVTAPENGDITGRLYGLNPDGFNQQITGLEFTGGFADLGVRSGLFDIGTDFLFVTENSFDLVAGSVQHAILRLLWQGERYYELRINKESINALMENAYPDGLSRGNGDGMQGVSFQNMVNVPEPTTIALMGLGFAGMGYMRRRQAKA